MGLAADAFPVDYKHDFDQFEAGDTACERDNVYYLQNVVFMVEGCLFKVPMHSFDRGSPEMRAMIMSAFGAEGERTSRIKLDGITRMDFKTLLTVMYPLDVKPRPMSLAEWTSVLRLSTLWQLIEIRTLSIERISTFEVEPTDKIVLSQEFDVTDWYEPACKELSARPATLTMNEAKKIGLETAVHVFHARERSLPCGCSATLVKSNADRDDLVTSSLASSQTSFTGSPGDTAVLQVNAAMTELVPPEDGQFPKEDADRSTREGADCLKEEVNSLAREETNCLTQENFKSVAEEDGPMAMKDTTENSPLVTIESGIRSKHAVPLADTLGTIDRLENPLAAVDEVPWESQADGRATPAQPLPPHNEDYDDLQAKHVQDVLTNEKLVVASEEDVGGPIDKPAAVPEDSASQDVVAIGKVATTPEEHAGQDVAMLARLNELPHLAMSITGTYENSSIEPSGPPATDRATDLSKEAKKAAKKLRLAEFKKQSARAITSSWLPKQLSDEEWEVIKTVMERGRSEREAKVVAGSWSIPISTVPEMGFPDPLNAEVQREDVKAHAEEIRMLNADAREANADSNTCSCKLKKGKTKGKR